ncbi:unnamed protein product [Prunus armeniaca]
MFLGITVRLCRIRRIVKRSPGYSGNANPRVRVSVTVQLCDRERSNRPFQTKRTPTQHTQQAGPSKGQAVWDYFYIYMRLCMGYLVVNMNYGKGILEGMLLWTLDLG